jgi:hypothetical protein
MSTDCFEELKNTISKNDLDEKTCRDVLRMINIYKKHKNVDKNIVKLKNELLTGSINLYDSVDDALEIALKSDKSSIVSFISYYKVFPDDQYFKQYMSSVEEMYNGLQQIPDHFENIPEDKEQSLVFECIFSTEEILKIIKAKFIHFFNVDESSIDISPIEGSIYSFTAHSIKGTFNDNSIKINSFISSFTDNVFKKHIQLKNLSCSIIHKKKFLEKKIMLGRFDKDFERLINVEFDKLKITNVNVTVNNNITNNNITNNNIINNITNNNNSSSKFDISETVTKYVKNNLPTKNVKPSEFYKNFKESTKSQILYKDFNKVLTQLGYKLKQDKLTYGRFWTL